MELFSNSLQVQELHWVIMETCKDKVTPTLVSSVAEQLPRCRKDSHSIQDARLHLIDRMMRDH